MLNLFFVRHGETEWNVERRLQGRLDSKLTSKGIHDARLL
ncbi:MAG TPA: histidine phosphatase family protein, partial [Bacillota bacterium]|nr:histidine phosphatase family protein [Bacillota bacterium]